MVKNQTILITGCSADGIGAVLALTLAKQHHRIFATARDTSKIPFELRSLPNVSVTTLDVSSKKSVAEAAKAVEEAGHCLDVLLLTGTYASSKAAINSISETLRLELPPFGVSVMTILLSTVATLFHANELIPELPETSYYVKILETITKWAKNELGPKGGSTQELVSSILPDIVASNRNGMDMMMSQDQGLDELAKA
ncbi:uncharacterized protein Triagg1_4069 [Trichoderma aggressivum f. europaeum]|uniref:Uncharacterized protein n=1 Tax=Trichoderma aggressivum f. europaeum TaxID=173218 RepID=A0AAE1IHR3_9HYPO|nr:hypothetical protein Triagg1_4069 [Trichoderma aggressivum f. europaeum]